MTDEPVKITLELKNVEGFETESATLTCDLSKTDRTDGQWMYNGQPLTASDRVRLTVDGHHQIVEFAELTIADAGQYSYHIENVSTSATLTVRGATLVARNNNNNNNNNKPAVVDSDSWRTRRNIMSCLISRQMAHYVKHDVVQKIGIRRV